MQKIPTLFVRDPDNRAWVLPQITEGCGWVVAGEGVPTRKYDGTCVMLDMDGNWWARREVKPGKSAPPTFWSIETDPVTEKTVGWEPIERSPFAKFHAEAIEMDTPIRAALGIPLRAGTYELIGPKINGNPEQVTYHQLISHALANVIDWPDMVYDDVPASFFENVRDMVLTLAEDGVEGVVWHHPDGRMAKIKARDFTAGRRTPASRTGASG